MKRFLCMMALIAIPLASAAETWPTAEFEVFEGVPWNSDNSIELEAGKMLHMAVELDENKPASKPLTPALRYEIEQFLYEVAQSYRKHFPAPRLEPLISRENDTPAYRVYYYDIPGAGQPYAQYAYTCSDSGRFRIEINAARFTEGGRITPKGYGDLAHELFHAVQRSTVAGKNSGCSGGVGDWVTEGQAEAIGHDMARTLRGVKVDTPISRWGLRYYSQPLFVPVNGPRSRAYQTSSFWRYLAELHELRSSGKRDAEGKPGPDLWAGYGTDYSYLADLMSRSPSATGAEAETRWLDDWMGRYFGLDLSRIYTDFVGVFAEYGRYRAAGSQIQGHDPDTYWREVGFGASGDLSTTGCEPVVLGPADDDAAVTLSLEAMASRCIELKVGDTGGPLGWVVQVVAESKAHLKQLRLVTAGGQQVSTSAPMADIPDASGAVAPWVFLLDPGKKQYLLVANVAQEAENTVPQTVQIRFTLEGRDDNKVSQDAGSQTPATTPTDGVPGPAGAEQTRQRRLEQMGRGPRGAGTATWDIRGLEGDCLGRAGCTPEVEFKFSSDSMESMTPFAASAGGLGGLVGQMLSIETDMAQLMRASMQVADQAGREVTIVVEGVDYGFTGRVSNADIRVSGGPEAEELMSRSPSPQYHTPPCVYPERNGVVTIEEFTPLIIRGSYQAQLVAGAVVRDVDKCPDNPVVDTISGRFVIAAPWLEDSRVAMDTQWVEEDQLNDINQLMPAGMQVSGEGGPGSPSPDPDPAEPGDFDEDVFDSGSCDCSCEALEKSMRASRDMMSGGQVSEEAMAMGLCMGQCMMQMPNCSFDFD